MRSESQGSYGPHYVQATLGFEKDHSSDEDFTPGGEVGADEEDASETDTPNVKPARKGGKAGRRLEKETRRRISENVAMPETVERTETVETLETVETTEKANPSETSDKSSENKLETLSPHFHKRLSSRGHNLTPHLRSTRRPTIFTSAFAVSSQRQHTTETTRTRYLQVFAGVTGFFAEHTVSHNMLDLLGNHKARYCGCLARFAHCYAGGRRNFFQILIRNENPTHSHLTTRAEAASYLTTKTLPIDDQDGEDVKTLADARASPKQITNFLNKRIGEESEFGKKEAGKVISI
ncbi:hypothetical protein PC110_g15832 [Phytophthora cactorum]|uniref:Uncharacterized protein n=1 Tax=Phytophthora cactorum TaxID=29920 RepID=A0A329RST0_9STRA|nr:hypothetical protein PC110_g15832 [Phytophthora cactorum]